MDEPRAPLHFRRNQDVRNTYPERGRRLPEPVEERGPYETNYTITLGYPEREVVTA